MGETKDEEHTRLQERTDELRQEHADLSLEIRPFSQAEHNEHSTDLRKHKADLAEHRRRDDD